MPDTEGHGGGLPSSATPLPQHREPSPEFPRRCLGLVITFIAADYDYNYGPFWFVVVITPDTLPHTCRVF